MTTVVVSKQCDHDSDLFPLWYHWYTTVFQADVIVVVPVKTPTSSIEKTIEFYKTRAVFLDPLKLRGWNALRVWTVQKMKAQQYFDRRNPFVLASADTDEFLEPFSPPMGVNEVFFREIGLTASETPTLDNIDQLRLQKLTDTQPWSNYRAAYVNSLRSRLVGVASHSNTWNYVDLLDHEVAHRFHLYFRGFDHFVSKVRSVCIDPHAPPLSSQHWRRWQRVLEDQGIETLRSLYSDLVSRVDSNDRSPETFKRFFSRSARLSESPPQLG